MVDEELMNLATQLPNLTPEAQEALLAELKQREINHTDVENHATQREIQALQEIVKLPNMPKERIRTELQAGAQCIMYQYCIW